MITRESAKLMQDATPALADVLYHLRKVCPTGHDRRVGLVEDEGRLQWEVTFYAKALDHEGEGYSATGFTGRGDTVLDALFLCLRSFQTRTH